MMRVRIVLGVALALGVCAALAQQVYRWTDDKGRVHLSDTPPPPGAKGIQKSGSATGGGAGAPQSPESEPYLLQLARKNSPVTLYSAPACDACNEARNLLNARGIPFKEVSVTANEQLEELKKAVGSGSVPSLVVGSTTQMGFEEATYHRILDAAGYPKTGVLRPRGQNEPKVAEPQAEVKPAPAAEETGPYAPGAPPQRPGKK